MKLRSATPTNSALARAALAAAAVALTATLTPSAVAAPAPLEGANERTGDLTAVAVTALNRLVDVNVTDGRQSNGRSIQGLQLLETVVGIDYRPLNGRLFGVVRDLLGDTRIVRINADSGRITLSRELTGEDGEAIRLRGVGFGVDFNPAADALRITSTSAQNLRVNVNSGVAVVDGDLAYAAGDEHEGRRPSIVASAYTNSDQFPSTDTELYDLDSVRDTLVLQNPPNDGTLETVARIPGLNVAATSGFDITSDSDLGVISTPVLLGTRLQVIDVEDGSPLLSRFVLLGSISDIALTPGQ